jgi:hypothetical protein
VLAALQEAEPVTVSDAINLLLSMFAWGLAVGLVAAIVIVRGGD